jgi:dihydroceramidase
VTGFWGPPTSSVDWCEANYAYSPYVAELFNTASSLAMVLVGLFGAWVHRHVLERRFLFAFGLLSLVGVGSVAFHGTLLFQLQMLDELPMVYLVTWMVYILVENGPTPRLGRWFPAALLVYVVIVTFLCTFTRGRVQFFVFHTSFGSLELFSLGRVWLLQRRLDDAPAKRLFRVGIASYVFAIVLWFIDLRACAWVSQTLPRHGIPNPQLHAWWHVLVSAGFYLLLLVIAVDRQRRIGRSAELRWSPLPVIGSSARGAPSASPCTSSARTP